MSFLCIDIGGTNTLIGAGDGDFDVIEKIDSAEFLEDIAFSVKRVLSSSKIDKIEKVAVAAAGPVDREKGVFYPPNLDIEEVNIEEDLQQFGELEIINDCSAAVLGEHRFGNHKTDNLLYITISSGIGGGAILDGNLVQGSDGNFAEVGHMNMGSMGIECGCGEKDHWEAYCSGEGLPFFGEALTGRGFEEARDIFDRFEEDNQAAVEVIEAMQEKNALAVENLVNLYNPEKIVFGGAMALNHPGLIVADVAERIEGKTMSEAPEISLCSLGEKSVLHGLRAVCKSSQG